MIGPSNIKIQKTGAKESATVMVAYPLLILALGSELIVGIGACVPPRSAGSHGLTPSEFLTAISEAPAWTLETTHAVGSGAEAIPTLNGA